MKAKRGAIKKILGGQKLPPSITPVYTLPKAINVTARFPSRKESILGTTSNIPPRPATEQHLEEAGLAEAVEEGEQQLCSPHEESARWS